MHGVGGHAHRRISGEHLGDGADGDDLASGAIVIDEVGRAVDQQPRGLDQRRHVGHHELQPLKRGDGPVELHALLGVAERIVQGAVRYAHRHRADLGLALVQRLHGDLEALALIAE